MKPTYPVTVQHLLPIAQGVVELGFNIPPDFSFIAGQYISVVLPELGEEQYHEFSLSSAPQGSLLTVTFRPSQSVFKQALLEKKPGDTISIEGPFGNFYPAPHAKHVVFIAGGIGVTPFYSIIKSQPEYPITLFTYNHDEVSSPYRKELSGLLGARVNEYFTSVAAAHFSDVPADADFFIAGPNGFVKSARDTLVTAGRDPKFLRTEEFTGYV